MLSLVRSAVVVSLSHGRLPYYKCMPNCTSGLRLLTDNSSPDQQGQLDETSTTIDIEQLPKKGKVDTSKKPVIDESDLDEKFISGWGPGGQKVNKAVNCCQLKHKPTGLIVKVHQSRKLEENRKIARELLALKLDNLLNGEDSVENQKKRVALHKLSVRDSQAQKKRELKEQHKRILANNVTDD